MRILTTESFSKITPLLRDNYANIHARLALKLSPDVADMFSRFTLQPSNGGAQWSVNLPDEDKLHPLADASEMEKDQISMALKRAAAEVNRQFPQMAEKLLTVPDSENIFFCRRLTGILVVLSAWGFRRVKASGSTPVIRLCLERAEQLTDNEVDLKIIYTDGTPVADQEFSMLIFNNEVPFATDSAGMYHAGHIRTGKTFTIQSADGLKSAPFVVEKDRTVYEVVLDKTTTLTVHVSNADNTPAANIDTYCDERHISTDRTGNAVYGPDIFSGGQVVTVGASDLPPVSHTLRENPADNIVSFSLPPKEKIDEHEKGGITDARICVKVVDKHGAPQCDMPVKVLCQKGFEESVTDHNGCVYINKSDLVPGEKPKVVIKRPKPSKKSKIQFGSSPTPPAPHTNFNQNKTPDRQ